MKTIPIAALAALALAATIPTSASADELANPVEGAVRKVYNFYTVGMGSKHKENFKETARQVKNGEKTPYSVGVDKTGSFKSLKRQETAMWEGSLKRKNGGAFTLTVSTEGNSYSPRYSLWINGSQVISAETETTAVDVNLNPGFNDFCLIVDYTNFRDVNISIKKKDSIKEPKGIGPGDLWHEDEPDDEEDDDE